jgi:hypothetical protein
MAELYDIGTGRKFIVHPRVSNPRKTARENDRFRRKFSWKNDVEPSLGFMKLKHDVLADVLFQLKQSKYDNIDYGSLSDRLISKRDKDLASSTRSAGLIYAGERAVHIVWRINSTNRKLKLCLGSEFFKN